MGKNKTKVVPFVSSSNFLASWTRTKKWHFWADLSLAFFVLFFLALWLLVAVTRCRVFPIHKALLCTYIFEPVSPQAALFDVSILEPVHITTRDVPPRETWLMTLNHWNERRKKPKSQRESNPRPLNHESPAPQMWSRVYIPDVDTNFSVQSCPGKTELWAEHTAPHHLQLRMLLL